MKVEIELNPEQLTLLDTNLKDCLLSLTKKQQTELLQNYINTQLESFRKEKSDSGYWRSQPEYEYTDFGKEITDNMRQRIEKAITDKMLARQSLQDYMEEVISNVSANLQTTIEKAISDYIINNLFSNKSQISQQVYTTINQMRG